MTKPKCVDCFYFEGYGAGECHRNAPIIRYRGEERTYEILGKFPNVMGDNWCGEFKEKEGNNK